MGGITVEQRTACTATGAQPRRKRAAMRSIGSTHCCCLAHSVLDRVLHVQAHYSAWGKGRGADEEGERWGEWGWGGSTPQQWLQCPSDFSSFNCVRPAPPRAGALLRRLQLLFAPVSPFVMQTRVGSLRVLHRVTNAVRCWGDPGAPAQRIRLQRITGVVAPYSRFSGKHTARALVARPQGMDFFIPHA